jgi:4-amino-4-deoxy-L-arabinose transferase-like glycosyltransferase
MGSAGAVPLDEEVAHALFVPRRCTDRRILKPDLIVIFVAALVFMGCMVSPPSLMDDVDAVQAQIARNMLDSGDWVTARLDGVRYLEKSPLKYWTIAVSYRIFGVHDWAARIPIALSTVLLCWLVARMGAWAFSPKAGLYAGLILSTSIGLFLFTRILIPDVVLTLTIALALWAFLRALDAQEPSPRLWAAIMAAAMGVGLLLKGLIAAVFPVAAALLYLAFTRQLLSRDLWRRLHVFTGLLIALLIAAPWHILATLRNPPYFAWTLESGPGHYRGFFWFYFVNEHVLRFLNRRFPRDYNTVPRLLFWLFHLLWLFPWSVFFPATFSRLRDGFGNSRAGRMRLLALCWTGFLLVFFTFSSTQEYYSMPCYPALALLLGSALASDDPLIAIGRRVLAVVAGAAALVIAGILFAVRGLPTPGDISSALTQNPALYTLSLGHMGDLTIQSFAYLRTPLVLAGLAFAIGAFAAWKMQGMRMVLGVTLMMVLFLHAARLALVVFDPYLSSRPLARALLAAPPGKLILDDQYYTWSSVIFYTNRRALLLNGRVNNLEYGSNAPDAPQDVFIDDRDFARLWPSPDRYYILVEKPSMSRLEKLVGSAALHIVAESGGKFLFSNH